jgi:hypothetical protein
LDSANEFLVKQGFDSPALQLAITFGHLLFRNILSSDRQRIEQLANKVRPLTFRECDSLLLDLY